jgi:hypothetical protein
VLGVQIDLERLKRFVTAVEHDQYHVVSACFHHVCVKGVAEAVIVEAVGPAVVEVTCKTFLAKSNILVAAHVIVENLCLGQHTGESSSRPFPLAAQPTLILIACQY